MPLFPGSAALEQRNVIRKRIDELTLISETAKIAELTDTITKLNMKGLDWAEFTKKRNKLCVKQLGSMTIVSRLCNHTYQAFRQKPGRLQNFHKELISAYDSISDDNLNLAWCPVMGVYMPRKAITQTHIVSQTISEPILADIFGSGEHTWNTKNGLVLSAPYKRLIDLGHAVIIPKIAKRTGDREFYFCLLSDADEIGSIRATMAWGEELQFREVEFIDHEHLPDFKYLYLHFVCAVLRRHRMNEDRESAAMALEPHAAVARKFWNTPVTRFARPILYTFSRNFGLLTREQANNFWGITDETAIFALLTEEELKDATNKANSLGFAATTMFSRQCENENWGCDSRWNSAMDSEWDTTSESEDDGEDDDEDEDMDMDDARGWKRWRSSDVDLDEMELEDEIEGWEKWHLSGYDSRGGKRCRM